MVSVGGLIKVTQVLNWSFPESLERGMEEWDHFFLAISTTTATHIPNQVALPSKNLPLFLLGALQYLEGCIPHVKSPKPLDGENGRKEEVILRSHTSHQHLILGTGL